MVNIVLISHGGFCEGLLDSLKMIAGGDYGVRAVPLIPGESPETYREKLSGSSVLNVGRSLSKE